MHFTKIEIDNFVRWKHLFNLGKKYTLVLKLYLNFVEVKMIFFFNVTWGLADILVHIYRKSY